MEFSEDFSNSNDHNTAAIIKRKRTKLPRPSSSTSSATGGQHFPSSISISSPTSSTGLSTTTEEDDLAASCLILLARGDSPPRAEEEIKSAERKTSSRKFTEMSVTTDGKVGMYVYECKTCNRTFPSFQALGGHRASHKKPKTAADALDRKKSPPPVNKEEKETTAVVSKITVMPLANRIGYLENGNKGKVHECSICGAEFGSGQALGGHMRRHRSALMTAKTGMNVDANMDMNTLSRESSEKVSNTFALDLNFPPEDESFRMFLADQQPRLVLSTAPMVNCHY